jgi:hypothetical protein
VAANQPLAAAIASDDIQTGAELMISSMLFIGEEMLARLRFLRQPSDRFQPRAANRLAGTVPIASALNGQHFDGRRAI